MVMNNTHSHAIGNHIKINIGFCYILPIQPLCHYYFSYYCREAAAWQNGELEKQIVLIQEELRQNDYNWDHDDDLQKESTRHKQLLDAIETLREQLPTLKDKIKNAKICGAGK